MWLWGDSPSSRTKEKPQKDVGGAKLHLESNPIPARDTQTNLVHTRTQRPHRGWDRTLSECLLQRSGSAVGCCRGRSSRCSRPELWHKPSWRRSPSAPPQSCQNLHRARKQTLGGHKQPCVHQVPGDRSSDPTRDWPTLACECPGVSGIWPESVMACSRVEGTERSCVCKGPFEKGWSYLHYLHHSLASGQTTGREHSPAYQQKIGLKIYWAWPRPAEQDPASPSVSLSHQEASMSVLSFSISGQTEWKP